jgi:hypothetical protein
VLVSERVDPVEEDGRGSVEPEALGVLDGLNELTTDSDI